jgi:hypothetical protein
MSTGKRQALEHIEILSLVVRCPNPIMSSTRAEHLVKERHRHVHILPQPVSVEITYYACLGYNDAGEITLGQDGNERGPRQQTVQPSVSRRTHPAIHQLVKACSPPIHAASLPRHNLHSRRTASRPNHHSNNHHRHRHRHRHDHNHNHNIQLHLLDLQQPDPHAVPPQSDQEFPTTPFLENV